VKNLRDIIGEIEARLDEKDEVRELALKSSRTIARLSSGAIHGLHKGEDSEAVLREAREEAMNLRSVLEDHLEIYRSGFVENALQELCEASIVHAIAQGKPLPSPRDCVATDAAYLLGLGDAVGELRRFALEELRRGNVAGAADHLKTMEDIFDALMRFDYPTALVALKRKQDVVRSLIEKTRGEVAVATRGKALEDKLDRLERRT
jgi:translin